MPIADLTLALMFVIFLALFVIIGIYPSFKRGASRIRSYIHQQEKQSWTGVEVLKNAQQSSFTTPQQLLRLNDFEIFVLRRLAQAGGKGLTRRQLQDDLHFDPVIIRDALASLSDQGLVQAEFLSLFRIRFGLSVRGREFAVEQGYLPSLHLR